MAPLLRIALPLPILLALAAPPADAQAPAPAPEVDCDSICLLPIRPPTDCACGIIGGGGGSGGGHPPDTIDPSWGPPGSGAEILMGLVESYEAQIAIVDDYVVIGRYAGQPVVWYYEKTPVDYPGLGRRDVMRRVPQPEISRRQSAEEGLPTAEQTLAGLAAAAAILAEYADELPIDQMPAEAQGHVARARFALAAMPFAPGGIAGDDEEEETYGDDAFWDPMFLSIMIEKARIASTIETEHGVVEQFVLSNADYDFSAITDMDVRRVTVWSVRDGPVRVPLRMEISAWDGLTPVTLTRRWDGRRWVGSMKPAHVVTDILDSGWRASMEIDRVLRNHGLPTSNEVACYLREARGGGRCEGGEDGGEGQDGDDAD